MTAPASTPVQPPPSSLHLRWPADRFYWSVLEAPGLTARGQLPAGLLADLEADVPSGEPLHAAAVPLEGGRIAVCAAPRSALEGLDQAALSLTPESIPPCIPGGPDPASFNLLTGALEPRPIARARARRHLLAAASLLLCAGLISLGLLRRSEHDSTTAASASAAAESLLASTGQTAPGLGRELERLRRAAVPAAAPSDAPDAAPTLAAILEGWPAKVPSKPVSIQVGKEGVFIEVGVEGDPTPFLSALKVPGGWALAEPRLNSAGSITRLSLAMRPREGSSLEKAGKEQGP